MVASTTDVQPPALKIGARFLAKEESRPPGGAAIVLLAASACPEYPDTRCVMDVIYRPGWTREQARALMDQVPPWTAPHFIPVSDPEMWVPPQPPGRPGEHSPLHRTRRRIRQMLAEMEAEIDELRGTDDYTAQQAKAEAYAQMLDLLSEMFGSES
jgi:hypothetical protein